MKPGILLTVQEEQVVDGLKIWKSVQSPTDHVLDCNVTTRIIMRESPVDGVYVEGENTWSVCRSDVLTSRPLFQQLSEPLRLGYHAAIRKQGNRCRQAKVKIFIQNSITCDTRMAGWAMLHGFASYMPMYWHVHDIVHARTMARIVMDAALNELAARRRPIMPKRIDPPVLAELGYTPSPTAWIGRVKERILRACYLCGEIRGQPGVFECESLYHMLVICPHVSMNDLRKRLLDDVKSLCQSADPQLPGTPEFPNSYNGRSEIWAVRCCAPLQ